MLRRFVLAVLFLAALPMEAGAQQPGGQQPGGAPQSAQSFLQSIYDPYLKPDFKGQPYNEAARFFAPDLARAMERDRRQASQRKEPPTLNGDPFVDAQEWKITNLVIRASGKGDAATGTISFDNLGKPQRLAVSMIRVAGDWRFTDITGASGSLRALFKLRQ